MPRNPLLALAIQPPDIIGAQARAAQTQALQEANTDRAARRQALQQFGGAAFGGDQTALQALAGTAPDVASQFQAGVTNRMNADTVRQLRAAQSARQTLAQVRQFNESKREGFKNFIGFYQPMLEEVAKLPPDQQEAGFARAKQQAARFFPSEAEGVQGDVLQDLPSIVQEGRFLARALGIERPIPQTREVIQGSETVTEQFNPTTGAFEEIGRGPRFKPESGQTKVPTAQTDAGKRIADLARFKDFFGEDSPQFKALQEADAEPATERDLTKEAGMRKEFTALSKDFIKVRDSAGRVRAAGNDPSAAGDLALIFNFMKILDPGSVVRESEFATAQNAAGVPERIRAVFNRIQDGERLTPVQRADFLNQAEMLISVQQDNHIRLEEQFRRLARSAGFNPDDIVIDFKEPPAPPPPQAQQTAGDVDISAMSLQQLNSLDIDSLSDEDVAKAQRRYDELEAQ